jgi:hypothetical protein
MLSATYSSTTMDVNLKIIKIIKMAMGIKK